MVAKKQTDSTSTTEVVPVDRWEGIDTWDRVVAIAQDLRLASEALGDGFTMITKAQLHESKLEFIILDWSEHLGDKGVYLSVRGITRDNRRFRFSDGSTGIMKQLQDFQSNNLGEISPIHCDGLSRSDYTNAEGVAGTTFYLK